MAEFNVVISTMGKHVTKIKSVENKLKKAVQELEEAKDSISVLKNEGVGSQVSKDLRKRINTLKAEAVALQKISTKMKENMSEIKSVYDSTEKNISGELVSICFGEYAAEQRQRFNIFANNNNAGTVNGGSPEYRQILQGVYENVPYEYRHARELYDKYADKVVVASYDAYYKGERSSYYRPSENAIYISMVNDAVNPRTPGTTYFHEFGHFIVDSENWISASGVCVGILAQFESAVKTEMGTFISAIEERFRKKGIKMGKSGKSLNKYVKDKTGTYLKEYINGVNDETCHVNNGLSDIIDGVSNGKYQPSYGHSETYWDEDPTNLANEAFAHMFEAQMTGDTTELKKMAEIMPNACAIFNNMIQSSI